jgi:hypothetical protein
MIRLAWVLAWCAAGCGNTGARDGPGGRSDDVDAFADQAQPTLARSCAFPACHGQPAQGLFLYAVGRTRAVPDPTYQQEQLEPLTPEELEHNLQAALAFVDAADPPHSDLLRRALPVSQGGRGHRGGVLFASRDDPGYQALLSWIEQDVTP